jgi:hypothetical protein
MPNAPDLYRKPERDWTGRKRRNLYRPARRAHLEALETALSRGPGSPTNSYLDGRLSQNRP